MNRLFYCLCLLLLGLGLASKKSELLAQGRITPDYLIQSEDLLRVTVFQEPTLSLGQTEGLRVSAKGNIPFPLLNEIPVAGKTVQQVKEDIERRLKDGYIKNPQVTVQVLQYNEQYYTVMGEVKIAGIYPLPPEKRIDLVEAIAKANGFTPNAKENSIELWREGERKRYDYNELLKIKDEDQKIYIKAGDKIDIPDRFF